MFDCHKTKYSSDNFFYTVMEMNVNTLKKARINALVLIFRLTNRRYDFFELSDFEWS